jgi:hypothetical protein
MSNDKYNDGFNSQDQLTIRAGENQSDHPQCAYSNLPSTRRTHLFYTRYQEQLAQMSECQRQRDRWGLTF